ncbi:MAG: phosphatase PAP2 family protein [Polyangiaceae bacterium]
MRSVLSGLVGLALSACLVGVARGDEGAAPVETPPSAAAAEPTKKAEDPPKKDAKPAEKTKVTDPRLSWRWPKYKPYQFGLTLGSGALAVASVAIPGQPNWTQPNAFDDAVRDVLRLSDPESSLYARDASDVGLVLLLNLRIIDTVFVTWWFHGKGSTALQMGLIDLQTIAFSASLNSFIAGVVGRERPYGRAICDEGDTAESSDCKGNNRYRSFFSGHSTAAFTMAALTCTHHINIPMYGGGPREAIPCAVAMATATGVALLRVVSDQHYLSDVIVGAAVGTAAGFGIPYAFHYAYPDSPLKTSLTRYGIDDFTLVATPLGVYAGGSF